MLWWKKTATSVGSLCDSLTLSATHSRFRSSTVDIKYQSRVACQRAIELYCLLDMTFVHDFLVTQLTVNEPWNNATYTDHIEPTACRKTQVLCGDRYQLRALGNGWMDGWMDSIIGFFTERLMGRIALLRQCNAFVRFANKSCAHCRTDASLICRLQLGLDNRPLSYKVPQ
jgi:hypothetical protein